VPIVTRLEPEKSRPHRTSVYLDGAFAFAVESRLALGLQVGAELTVADVTALERRQAVDTALQQALRYLAFRPRSADEVARYLARKEVPAEIAEQVLARLREAGYVDDQQFAALWVDSRVSFRPRARWALRSELRDKGIDAEIAEEAVSAVDEEVGAMQVARKALPHVAHLGHDLFVHRLMGRLQRRGYGFETARRVVDVLWNELHPEAGSRPDQP